MMSRLSEYEFNSLMDSAKHSRDPNAIMKIYELIEKQKAIEAAETQAYVQPPYIEPQKLSWEMDEYRNKKSVTINVQIMVENLLGGPNPNRDVQVRLEKYGDKFHG